MHYFVLLTCVKSEVVFTWLSGCWGHGLECWFAHVVRGGVLYVYSPIALPMC